jgi:hypothetical protein
LKIQSPLFPKDVILEHSEELSFINNSGLIQSVLFHEKDAAIISLTINNPRAKNIVFEKRSS